MLQKLFRFITKYYLYSFVLLIIIVLARFLNLKKKDSSNRISVSTIKDSTLIDPRDGQSYRIRSFGKLWWMIDNLNFDSGDSLYYRDIYIGKGSYCYNNNLENATKYGRLYDLSSAVDACPKGWRLPFIKEWIELNEKYSNCTWDKNSSTGNYRKQLPSFEPVGSGHATARFMSPKEYNEKRANALFYSMLEKEAIYWSQEYLLKQKPYFFKLDMGRCEARKGLYQGASTRKQLAQQKFYACRCVQEIQ